MKRLLYLSGAARVSTGDQAVLSGPRAHILGTIAAFRKSGFIVENYIVGDLIKLDLSSRRAEVGLSQSKIKRILADMLRIILCLWHSFRSFLLYKKPDIVYERFGIFQCLGILHQIRGSKWIVESNGIYSLEAKSDRTSIYFGKIAFFLEKFTYNKCDILVCVSDNLKEEIVNKMRIDENKIVVIPNGIDAERFKYSPNTKNTKKIGFVGSLVAWQGLDILLHALNRISASHSGFEVDITGDGPELDKLKALSKDLDLDQIVNFRGSVPWSEIPKIISSYDICYSGQVKLNSMSMYHSPLKIYEYLAIGRPVIASDFQDARHAVKGSGAGYLFESGNTDSLIKALKYALEDRDNWSRMGEIGSEFVVSNFSWERRIAKLIIKLEEIEAKNG